ncbi:hypothetical protein [Intestinibacter sp.]
MNTIPEEFYNEIKSQLSVWQDKINDFEKINETSKSETLYAEIRGLKSWIRCFGEMYDDMKGNYL